MGGAGASASLSGDIMTRPAINESQLRQVRRAIREAELTPEKAKKLLIRIAKYGLMPAARRNVKTQQTPDGAGWAPRKRPDKARGKYKNKMLLGLPKLLAIRVDGNGKSVRLFFKKGDYNTGSHAGAVAWVQQHGATIQGRARKRRDSGAMRAKPATQRQAERLLSLGFRAPTGAVSKKTGRRGRRKPSRKWITENMNMAQAGLVISILKGEQKKRVWEIKIPSRAFLGTSDADFTRILEAQLRSLNYGSTR